MKLVRAIAGALAVAGLIWAAPFVAEATPRIIAKSRGCCVGSSAGPGATKRSGRGMMDQRMSAAPTRQPRASLG